MDDQVVESVVLETINDVVDTAFETITANKITKLVIPFAAGGVLSEMNRVLDWAYISYDVGEQVQSAKAMPPPPPSSSEIMWHCEAQAEPAIIDLWARGVVQTKKRVKKDEFADRLLAPESPSASSARSRQNTIRSSRSVGTPNGGRQKSFVGGKMEGDDKLEGDDKPFVVIEVNEPGGNKKKQEGYELTPAEHAYMLEMKEQQDRAKRDADEAAKKLADEREHQAQWEQQMQELKGKDYTFGLSGEIILINAIRPEKLPTSAYPVPAIVHDKLNPEAVQPPPPKSKKKRRGSKVGNGKKMFESGGPADYFTISASLQPPILDVCTVGPSVSIKQGEKEKQGPERLDDPQHMSRKEYLAKLMGDDQTTAFGSDGDDGMAESVSTAGSMTDRQIKDDARDDVSQLTGSPRTQASDFTFLAGGKKKAMKAPAPEYAEPEEDENLKLVKAPDWGAVGPQKEPTIAKLPRKPNPKQRSRTISPRSKKPRDRLAEEAITFTGDSKRLPAPPLGASTGHGFYPRHHAYDDDGALLTARSGVSERSFLPRISGAQGASGGASLQSGLTGVTGASGMHSRSRKYGQPGRVESVSASVASAETARKLGLR